MRQELSSFNYTYRLCLDGYCLWDPQPVNSIIPLKKFGIRARKRRTQDPSSSFPHSFSILALYIINSITKIWISICFCCKFEHIFCRFDLFNFDMGSTSSDCSRGICSIYCPQWCYIVFPPPPPEDFLLKDGDNSSPVLSPMIVALIGILAGVFLLLTYYTIISKYCVERRRNVAENTNPDQIRENQSQGNSFQVATTPGLDQSAITSIAVFKYKKEEGLIEGTDCSVCLNEFQEEESLRILPKCTHAFHLPCIDPWLKSNSSCPICRAVISPMANFPAPSDPRQRTMDGRLSALQRHRGDDTVLVVHDCVQEGVITILMRPETEVSGNWQLRRPVPMDSTSRGRQQLLVADVLRSGEDREGDTSREYGKPGGGTLDSMKG